MQGIKNLTHGPINRQLFNLAMPIMATSFIQMAYSLTDMAWVGRLGSEAVAAIGSVGILTWMSGSISLLNKVGSEVSVGQSIGAQNQEDARHFASHNITIALIISLCWGGLLFILAEPIICIYELEVHITANKNTVPGEKRSPFVTSGLRLGTPAVTTRGMGVNEMKEIADCIADCIYHFDTKKDAITARVDALTAKFPLYE